MCSHCTAGNGYVCTGDIGGPSTCTGVCGNAIRTLGEGCDNGNLPGCVDCQVVAGYTCLTNLQGSSICAIVPGCGNGVFEPGIGEECDTVIDTSADPDADGCTALCTIVAGFTCAGEPSVCNNCGNGIVEGNEQCDGSFGKIRLTTKSYNSGCSLSFPLQWADLLLC